MKKDEGRKMSEHHLQDKGYKVLFGHKDIFLEFVKTFIKKDWVKDICEEDLIKVDKEYVTEDYRKKEADIVYRMKFKQGDLQDQEVIFYVLLELQSSVDNLMPLRLLNYMTRIWLQETKKKVKEQQVTTKLPAIIPVVLYNGKSSWHVPIKFREMLHENKRFEEYLVDFTYVLVDVNAFSGEELFDISNAISLSMMMDQKDVSSDVKALLAKLDAINEKKEKLPARHLEAIIEFISVVVSAKYDELYSEQIKEAIRKNIKEGKSMTYAIEILMDSEREKSKMAGIHEGIEQGIEKGIEQDKRDVAKAALLEGASVEFIAKITKLDIEVIKEIQKELM